MENQVLTERKHEWASSRKKQYMAQVKRLTFNRKTDTVIQLGRRMNGCREKSVCRWKRYCKDVGFHPSELKINDKGVFETEEIGNWELIRKLE